MADVKISALPGATTPLAGTEVLPIVQSSSTKKVSIADVTAGRAISASGVTISGQTANTLVAFDNSKNVVSVTTAATAPLAGTEELSIIQSGSAKKVSIANVTAGRSVAAKDLAITTAGTGGLSIAGIFKDATTVGNAMLIGLVNNEVRLYSTWDSVGANMDFSIYTTTTAGAQSNDLKIAASNGDVTVGRGNLVIGTSGKGIDFSATSHPAGMTSELLSDYEEGTWTPVVAGSTTAGTGTYTSQVGTYVKTGNLVMIAGRVTYNSHTGTGNLTITGAPFTSKNESGIEWGSLIFDMTGIVQAANTIPWNFIGPNSTTINLFQTVTGGGAQSAIAMDAAGSIWVNLTYQTAT